jgi:hypothetical protein
VRLKDPQRTFKMLMLNLLDTIDDSDLKNYIDTLSMCWVRLYQILPPDVPGPSMADCGTRSMTHLGAMGRAFDAMERAFDMRPVPIDIYDLRLVVEARSPCSFNQVRASNKRNTIRLGNAQVPDSGLWIVGKRTNRISDKLVELILRNHVVNFQL